MSRLELFERVRWAGLVVITVWRPGWRYEQVVIPNLIVDAGKDLLVTALDGADTEIRYMAWGGTNTAPAAGDTQLGSELGRKQITDTSNPAGVGNLLTTTYLAPNDANVQIEELGWFASPTATATADSGVLVARVLYSHLKVNTESIQIDRTDTLS